MPIVDPSPKTYACYNGKLAETGYEAMYGKEKATSMLAIFQGCSSHASFMK